jgi:hypothetical protein
MIVGWFVFVEPPDSADDTSCYDSGGYQANRNPGYWVDCVLDDPRDPTSLQGVCGVTLPVDYCFTLGWEPEQQQE